MSQSGALTLSGGGGGVVTSVTGANGVTASPTTGAVVVSGINATTSSVGVARFNPAQFSITAGAVSLIGASTLAIQTINSLPPNAAANFTINTSNTNIQFVAGGNTITWNGNPANNLLIGSRGASITSAGGNVGYGSNALSGLTSGNSNTIVGAAAGGSISTASSNVFLGSGVGQNVNGSFNTLMGYSTGTAYVGPETANILINNAGVAGESNTTRIGLSQTACYLSGIAGVTITTPTMVTINSSGQLGNIATVNNGVLIVSSTGIPSFLPNGTTGQVLTATTGLPPSWEAESASGAITTITGNTGPAESPLVGNFNFLTTGSTVKFSGTANTETLAFAITNLVFGSSLPALTSGTFNVGVGSGVLTALTSGSLNATFGYETCISLTTGSNNTSAGTTALALITSGSNNCAFGQNALGNAATSSGTNTAFGTLVFSSIAGICSRNIGIGYTAGSAYTTTESNNIIIGNPGVIGESNVLRIGTNGSGTGQQNLCYIAGINGVNVGSVATIVSIQTVGSAEVANQLGTVTLVGAGGTTITPTANTITVTSAFAPMPWIDEAISFAAAVNTGYFVTATATATLPAAPAQSNIIAFAVDSVSAGAGFLTIQANTGQFIQLGPTISASAGIAVSNFNGDTLTLVYRASDSHWVSTSRTGTWTVT